MRESGQKASYVENVYLAPSASKHALIIPSSANAWLQTYILNFTFMNFDFLHALAL